MSHTLVQGIRAVQALSMLALVGIFIRPHATWSLRARLPVALILFASCVALLIHDIL